MRKPNSLNLIRLLLATVVIVAHSWPLGGFGDEWLLGTKGFGTWAVDGFFCISGFLIASSRMRLPPARFLWNRALRILPGFWVCLAVVAFVAAPISSLASGEVYSLRSGLTYVTHNAGLQIFQWNIGHTLTSVPHPGAGDGSLWTLYIEAIGYVAATVVLTGWLRRHATTVCLVLLAGAAGVLPWATSHVSTNLYLNCLELGVFFLAGMVLFTVSDRLSVSALWAGTAVLLLIVTILLGVDKELAPLPLAYLLMWAGAVIPPHWAQRNDISYGVYVYAFPVQQLLALAGAQVWGWWAYMVLSVALTVPVAWASWLLVEQPALRFKSKRPRRTFVREPIPVKSAAI